MIKVYICLLPVFGKHTENIRKDRGFSPSLILWLLVFVGLFSGCGPARRAIRHDQIAVPPNFYPIHSQQLGFRLSGTEDPRLIAEVSSWLGVPYRYGGFSRAGADCSGFVWTVFRSAYNLDLPRTTEEQAWHTRKLRRRRLRVGDLVFFRTQSRWKISHVGIYLGNDKFIHASTSRGVIVSDLDEPYYARTFVYGGRIR